MPNLKPNPNRKKYIEILRGMTPQQRWDKAFEMTARARELFEIGLRQRFPHLSESELKALMLKRLERCHNRNW